ncbi:hypothetical protein [Paractinoplanes brasiliensis]|uniref:Uncharacterized protein n=1 Tax=Paractinoplanes brasiliensis TaxID=52695 RepID=A0A4R6JZY7_9ACTN|nr:hypothetical protein [Actinoplanes brasiliensis]TDO42369.1 hypothetical protein C8E87_6139 [Actinoplanes brasiliensis]GID29602.1 hypothetical protein Abr02nite_45850 [Actinoplanes brasiliensis]
MSTGVVNAQAGHSASWWGKFLDVSDRFDAASVAEHLGDEIIMKIPSRLLRREAEIAAEVVVRHLNKPASSELAERANRAIERLEATVQRLDERAAGSSGLAETFALCHVLRGRFAEGAAEAERFVGTAPILEAFMEALRLERFDSRLALRLMRAGQSPEVAVRSGLAVGKYAWWPDWLLTIVTEKAVAGTLDEETIQALDQCAYADLTPTQARVARQLLRGDEQLLEATAQRLESLGAYGAAGKLRDGDLMAVALAARMVPL